MVRRFHAGNLAQIVPCILDERLNMLAPFISSSTFRVDLSPLNFMWCLMIGLQRLLLIWIRCPILIRMLGRKCLVNLSINMSLKRQISTLSRNSQLPWKMQLVLILQKLPVIGSWMRWTESSLLFRLNLCPIIAPVLHLPLFLEGRILMLLLSHL